MSFCREHDFGEIRGFELNFGPVKRPLLTVFFYMLDGILIDTGLSNLRKKIFRILNNYKIEQVILTHYHLDHSGNAAYINRKFNVPVMGHPLTVRNVSKGFRRFPYQLYVWGNSEKFKMEELPLVIDSGKYALIPIHTPGHTEDHTVFLDKKNGWLFSGDLYIGPRIKYFRSDENIRDTIESLKKILKYDFQSVFCAHRPSIKYGKRFMKKKLDYLENLYGHVSLLLDQGYPEKQIIRKMGNGTTIVKILTLGEVCFSNLVKSAIATIKAEKAQMGA